MLFVALGHWLVIAIAVGEDGSLVARNALEVAPEFAVLTWLFQVMPLFFAVGGFASAMSLDAHRRRAGTDGDWVVQRLRRLVAPTVVLSGTWLILLAGGTALGAGGLVAAGAVGAAIPLWFLANYTIDTALAPTMLTALRRHRTRTMTLLLGVFLVALVLLVPIVAVVGRFERTALLAERVPWTGTAPHALALALVVAASLKVWSLGNAGSVAAGAAGIVLASVLLRRGRLVRPTT